MNSSDAVDFQSLNMVRDELVATIDDSARHLELFVSSQDDGESLQSCIDGIQQIVGILKLIQFHGACLLAEELLHTATDIVPGGSGAAYERRLEVISNTFFVLTRYLEYVQQRERKVPVLLIPHINELRKIRGESTFPESHFHQFSMKPLSPPEIDPFQTHDEDFKQVIKRLRHMYQVGLLGFVRERQLKNSMAMMRRSLIRLQRLAGHDKPLCVLWWLANITLDAMIQEEMAVVETRKKLFGRIDRVIRQIEMSGEAAFSAAPPKGLIKELIYLLNLSGANNDEVQKLKMLFDIKSFPYTDKELSSEREALKGPSAHTVSSLAKVLQTELSNTKKILENASHSSDVQIDDLDGFAQNLSKVAEILAVVGLASASNILKKETQRIKGWRGEDNGPTQAELGEVANTLLYLESTVVSLEQAKLSDEKLGEANKIAQRQVVASSELAEAERIVVEESEAGLSLTKRALSSFSDSNYDVGHIRNISKTLNTVRGGMIMLRKMRAALVLERCVEFVDEVLFDQDHPAALKELLETFADVIISIEYYLDSATASLQMNESVLQVAEESLEALGFPVENPEEAS